jgi:hypothetical protein
MLFSLEQNSTNEEISSTVNFESSSALQRLVIVSNETRNTKGVMAVDSSFRIIGPLLEKHGP